MFHLKKWSEGRLFWNKQIFQSLNFFAKNEQFNIVEYSLHM